MATWLPGIRGLDEMTSPRAFRARCLGIPIFGLSFHGGPGSEGPLELQGQVAVPAVSYLTSRWQHWRARVSRRRQEGAGLA